MMRRTVGMRAVALGLTWVLSSSAAATTVPTMVEPTGDATAAHEPSPPAPNTSAAATPDIELDVAPANKPATPPETSATPPPASPPPATTAPDPSPDPVWSQLEGHALTIVLDDGTTVAARYVGQRDETLVFSRTDDNLVFALPKHRVSRVFLDPNHAPAEPSTPPPPTVEPRYRGTGFLIAAGVLLGAGAIATTVVMMRCDNELNIDCYFGVVPGMIAMGGSIPLFIIGSKKRHRYDAYQHSQTPVIGAAVVPSQTGATAAVMLRF